MNAQEWADLAKQIAGIVFEGDEATYVVPTISRQWNGGITLHYNDGHWDAQYEIRTKTEPDLGAPYTAQEVREMLIDLTRTWEISQQLNAIMPSLEGATK